MVGARHDAGQAQAVLDQAIAIPGAILQRAAAVFMADDRQHQGMHDVVVVHIHTLIWLHAEAERHGADVGLRIVFVLRRPTLDELTDSAELVFVLIGDQRAGDGAHAPLGADELDECRIGLAAGTALPARAGDVADIAGVVIADTTWLLRWHGDLLSAGRRNEHAAIIGGVFLGGF
ncbi:hypothetical protein D3C78_1445100 [compost metagenome]